MATFESAFAADSLFRSTGETYSLVANGSFWAIQVGPPGAQPLILDTTMSTPAGSKTTSTMINSWNNGVAVQSGAMMQKATNDGFVPILHDVIGEFDQFVGVVCQLLGKCSDAAGDGTYDRLEIINATDNISYVYVVYPNPKTAGSASGFGKWLLFSFAWRGVGGPPVQNYSVGATPFVPSQAVVTLRQNSRRFISPRLQVNLMGAVSAGLPADIEGVVCRSGNPSSINATQTNPANWNTVPDTEIDLQDGQSIFGLLGRVFTTPGAE